MNDPNALHIDGRDRDGPAARGARRRAGRRRARLPAARGDRAASCAIASRSSACSSWPIIICAGDLRAVADAMAAQLDRLLDRGPASRRARSTSWARTCRRATSGRASSTAHARRCSSASGRSPCTSSSAPLLGLAAGFYGRCVDQGLMRFTDTIMAIPPLLLIIVFVAVVGPSIVLGHRGHRPPRLAGDGATRARSAPGPARVRVHHRGPGDRRHGPDDPDPAHAAQYPWTADRGGHIRRRDGGAPGVQPQLPRPRRPATRGQLGQPHHGGGQSGGPHASCRGNGFRRRSRSPPRCWRSTSSATDCGTRSIRRSTKGR